VQHNLKPGTKRIRSKQKMKAASVPVNRQPSNASGDKISYAILFGALILGFGVLGTGLVWSANGIQESITDGEVDWLNCLLFVILSIASFLAAGALLRLALFGSVMAASKMAAWQSLETISRQALKVPSFITGGSSWGAVVLVQSLVSRGLYDDAISVADKEWKHSGEDKRQMQNLGPMCAAVAVANQAGNHFLDALTWNERAIECLEIAVSELSKPRKGLLAKAAQTQNTQFKGQLQAQLAATYFNCANVHFNSMNHRKARKHYDLAVKNASAAPPFPQKNEILKLGREQLKRLKNA
jgi:tetratricopeptide (TPR) repeat protein